jgi:hypothetical protein
MEVQVLDVQHHKLSTYQPFQRILLLSQFFTFPFYLQMQFVTSSIEPLRDLYQYLV